MASFEDGSISSPESALYGFKPSTALWRSLALQRRQTGRDLPSHETNASSAEPPHHRRDGDTGVMSNPDDSI